MDYLDRLPQAVPEGHFLVHNHVRPTRRLGSRGFRAWLARRPGEARPLRLRLGTGAWPHFRIDQGVRL